MTKYLSRRNKLIFGFLIGFLLAGIILYFSPFKSKKFPENYLETKEKCLAPDRAIVTKVLDGDTIIVEGGVHVRLLGIDADEKGYPCYEPAKKRLEQLLLNKEVFLEKDKTDIDKYGRCLRYVFLGKKNINLELVKEGLAIARFYFPDVKYKEEIKEAEKYARENKLGCKWKDTKTKK